MTECFTAIFQLSFNRYVNVNASMIKETKSLKVELAAVFQHFTGTQ